MAAVGFSYACQKRYPVCFQISDTSELHGYVHTGVVSERFQKCFHLFYRFDALFTRTKGKYFQCIELAPTSAVNC